VQTATQPESAREQPPRWAKCAIAATLVATIGLRLGLAWALTGRHPFVPLYPDMAEYRWLAHNLVQHGHFGFGPDWRQNADLARSPWSYMYDNDGFSMFRPPGYPFLLSIMERVRLGDVRHEQALLALLEGVTALVMCTLASRLFGWRSTLIAAAFFLVNPGLSYALTKGGREPFLTIFWTAGFLSLTCLLRRPTWQWAVMAGVWFGLAGYFKETLTMAGGVAALFLAYRARHTPDHRAGFGLAGLMLAATAVPLAPWIIRNSIHLGRPVLSPSLTGLHLNNAVFAREWIKTQPSRTQAALDPRTATDPLEADRRLAAQVRLFARTDPARFSRTLLLNAVYFWLPFPQGVATVTGSLSPADLIALLYYVPCLSLAAWGLWKFRRRPESRLLIAVLLFMTAVHALSGGFPRYRFPFEPVLLVYAAGAAAHWFSARNEKT